MGDITLFSPSSSFSLSLFLKRLTSENLFSFFFYFCLSNFASAPSRHVRNKHPGTATSSASVSASPSSCVLFPSSTSAPANFVFYTCFFFRFFPLLLLLLQGGTSRFRCSLSRASLGFEGKQARGGSRSPLPAPGTCECGRFCSRMGGDAKGRSSDLHYRR